MARALNLLGICDVSVGYGSPEITALMHDLACCDWIASAHLIEADEPDRPPASAMPDSYRLTRIHGAGLPAQSLSWTRHFINQSAKIANESRPDILILFGGAVFPVVALLDFRPQSLVYHAYEQIADLPAETLAAHQALLGEVDLVITPSVRRLIHDASFLGTWPKAVHTMYNAADVAYPNTLTPKPNRSHEPYLLWCGALDRNRTFADYFFSPELSDIRIDMYGRLQDDNGLRQALVSAPNISHHGIVPADRLHNAVAQAAYSIVWWNPANSYGHLHLASNRFFSSIQMGTPSLCAPHPQCLEIARRFDCAIVMEDWSREAFVASARRAVDLFGTDAYDAMVSRCHDARDSGLNWPHQSQGITAAIRETLCTS